MASQVLSFVSLGLSCLALLLQIVDVALPNWVSLAAAGVKGTSGLWKNCIVSRLLTGCETIPEAGVIASGYATRAMELIAMFLMVGVIVIVVLRMFVLKDKDFLILVAAGVAFAAGVFSLIGIIIYGAKYESQHVNIPNVSMSLGVAFILCIISCIISLVDGAVLVVMKVRSIEGAGDHVNL